MGAKKAIIIGAGPAGLTAAHELLEQTDVLPLVLEADACVGGLSRTVDYKGNRIDIGGAGFHKLCGRHGKTFPASTGRNRNNCLGVKDLLL